MKNNFDTLSVSVLFSIILHLLIIYFFIFGIPSLFPKLPEEQVIVFEMLPVSDQSNVPNKIKQNDKAIENEDARKVEQNNPNIEKEKKPEPKVEEKKPEPKIEEKKPEPKVEEKKPEPKIEEKKPEPKVEEKKPEPKIEEKKPEPKVEEKKPEAKVEEKKPVEKKKKIPDKSDLDSLLKNLEQSSEGSNAKSNKQARSKQNDETDQSKGSYDDRLPLSISEMSLIKQQIERHWNVPIGAQNIEQARISLYIAFNQDGSVLEVKMKEALCPNISSNICNALTDSAIRAVWQASPINNLDSKRYKIWQEVILTFDPSKM